MSIEIDCSVAQNENREIPAITLLKKERYIEVI